MSIEVQHIHKTFGAFAALSDVSLRVPDGELVALLGPSGSGKTTLLRIIAGLETVDERSQGKILFHEKDVAELHAGKRSVGFVFQHYALFRHMTVFENVAFGLRVRPRKLRPGKQAIRERVEELLGLVQLQGLAGRYPSQLSGGQRQRVALARALAVEPKVLLLDEPFGALDAKVRLDLRRWLRKLHDEIHVTSLFVTHDQEEALEVADRIVIMNKGRVEQQGTPEEVFHNPANEFVLNFLGNVNLFHGRVEHGKAVFGSLVLDPATEGLAGAVTNVHGKSARMFVRPHDLEIHTTGEGRSALRGRVTRVQSAGPQVKVELRGEEGQSVNVELSHERFRELGLSVGSEVFVSPKQARVYVEDYSI